ncbi:MAG: hypothetical protein D6790_11960 [Caldilineae bacterium]|nr:MAG: hypothetical protein D6790_11960 [Caldilineae bacterium]
MTSRRLFTGITWRTMAGFWAGAWLVQMLTMALFAALGVFAANVNRPQASEGGVYVLQALVAIFFLVLVGAVGSGLFSLPIGMVVGFSAGLLLSLVTRLFFYPPPPDARYRFWSSVLLGGYGFLAGWVTFMGVVLLLSRENRLHSQQILPWSWAVAGLVALCGVVVAQWIVHWYTQEMHNTVSPVKHRDS